MQDLTLLTLYACGQMPLLYRYCSTSGWSRGCATSTCNHASSSVHRRAGKPIWLPEPQYSRQGASMGVQQPWRLHIQPSVLKNGPCSSASSGQVCSLPACALHATAVRASLQGAQRSAPCVQTSCGGLQSCWGGPHRQLSALHTAQLDWEEPVSVWPRPPTIRTHRWSKVCTSCRYPLTAGRSRQRTADTAWHTARNPVSNSIMTA